jgi:hypothetical protein
MTPCHGHRCLTRHQDVHMKISPILNTFESLRTEVIDSRSPDDSEQSDGFDILTPPALLQLTVLAAGCSANLERSSWSSWASLAFSDSALVSAPECYSQLLLTLLCRRKIKTDLLEVDSSGFQLHRGLHTIHIVCQNVSRNCTTWCCECR